MIEYRILTRHDVELLRAERASIRPDSAEIAATAIPRAGLQRGATAISDIDCNQDLEPDAPRAIAAYDDGRMVGRLQIVYADLLVNGRLMRCIVSEDFFVLDEYRDRAVGLTILLKALKLGFPFIQSAVSGQMKQILDSWKQFVRVDASPMYLVPLDRPGVVQMARWDLYGQDSPRGFLTDKLAKASTLLRCWRQRQRLSGADHRALTPLSASETSRGFERCLATSRAPVQLPWNRALLERALAGQDPNLGAWFVESAGEHAGMWLVTLYRQERVLGHDAAGTPRSLREAHLNEIYPPVGDDAPAEALLAFARDRAAAMGASVLQIHALTPAIESACRRLGLGTRMTKSIYIAASGVDQATRKQLSDPAQWWCRAFNENQFEEVFLGRALEAHRGGLLC